MCWLKHRILKICFENWDSFTVALHTCGTERKMRAGERCSFALPSEPCGQNGISGQPSIMSIIILSAMATLNGGRNGLGAARRNFWRRAILRKQNASGVIIQYLIMAKIGMSRRCKFGVPHLHSQGRLKAELRTPPRKRGTPNLIGERICKVWSSAFMRLRFASAGRVSKRLQTQRQIIDAIGSRVVFDKRIMWWGTTTIKPSFPFRLAPGWDWAFTQAKH